jgi:hypothetical protein
LQQVSEGEVKGDHALTFNYLIPAKGWGTVTTRTAEIFGPNGLASLTDHGIIIHEPDLFKKYVKLATDELHRQELHVRYDQYGFKPEGFLYGKLLYTKQGVLEVPLNEELTIRNRWIGPGTGAHGDVTAGLECWKQTCNKLFVQGCEAQSVTVLAGFAAPIMRFLVHDEGGAILSLVSETSNGKTVALAGAASIWGLRKGLGLTNEDNRVTKFLTLGALGNLPLIYDEIALHDPVFIRSLVTNFTNGRDKMRADTSGRIRHSANEWQTIMLTASNASMVDVLKAGNEADAPAYRVLEIETSIPTHLKEAVGERLRLELERNAGFAGDVYARYLVDHQDQVKSLVWQVNDMVHAKLALPERYRFWRRLVVCITVAGVLVRNLGLLELSIDRLSKWLFDVIRAQAAEEPVQANKLDWQYRELARFVSIMQKHTLIIAGNYERNKTMWPLREPRDQLLARYESGSKKYTVAIDSLKAYAVERGFPWHSWCAELQRENVMTEIKKLTLTAGTEIPGAQLRVCEINLAHPLVTEITTETLMKEPGNVIKFNQRS